MIATYLIKNYSEEFDFSKITEQDCICTHVLPMEERFIPINCCIPVKEYLRNVASIPVYPDKEGRLYEYNYIVMIEDKKDIFSDGLEYLGNFTLPIPKNNFIHTNDESRMSDFVDSMTVNDFIDEMLGYYENNNLKKSILLDNNKFKEIRKSFKEELLNLVNDSLMFEEMEKAGINIKDVIQLKNNPNTEVDPETGDTLTYVGPPRDKEDINLEDD